MLPLKYPSTITLNVASIPPRNIIDGIIGSLGKVVDDVTSFFKLVSVDVFVSMLFTLEVTDSLIFSLFLLKKA